MVFIFFNEHLRSPNNDNKARVLVFGQNYRFPRMLGSIDCMRPKTWKDMYTGHICELTVILEQWHHMIFGYDRHFFGLQGSRNDINVLE